MLSHPISHLRSVALLGIALILAGCTGGSGAGLVPSTGTNSSSVLSQSAAGPGTGSVRTTLPVDNSGGGKSLPIEFL